MIFKTQHSNIALGEGWLGYWGRGWEAKIELGKKVLYINLLYLWGKRGEFFFHILKPGEFFFRQILSGNLCPRL